MICMTESWMALASSRTGREIVLPPNEHRVGWGTRRELCELMTSLRSCHCWWKKQKR